MNSKEMGGFGELTSKNEYGDQNEGFPIRQINLTHIEKGIKDKRNMSEIYKTSNSKESFDSEFFSQSFNINHMAALIPYYQNSSS